MALIVISDAPPGGMMETAIMETAIMETETVFVEKMFPTNKDRAKYRKKYGVTYGDMTVRTYYTFQLTIIAAHIIRKH